MYFIVEDSWICVDFYSTNFLHNTVFNYNDESSFNESLTVIIFSTNSIKYLTKFQNERILYLKIRVLKIGKGRKKLKTGGVFDDWSFINCNMVKSIEYFFLIRVFKLC